MKESFGELDMFYFLIWMLVTEECSICENQLYTYDLFLFGVSIIKNILFKKDKPALCNGSRMVSKIHYLIKKQGQKCVQDVLPPSNQVCAPIPQGLRMLATNSPELHLLRN